MVCVELQPGELTVYVVVTVGEAVTVAPLAELRVAAGVHVYVLPPLTVNGVFCPGQIVAVGDMVKPDAAGSTTIFTHLFPGQPAAFSLDTQICVLWFGVKVAFGPAAIPGIGKGLLLQVVPTNGILMQNCVVPLACKRFQFQV